MLRFRIGPIPIEVHFSHFVFAALMGMGGGLAGIAVWVGVVFVSALTHELGHALAALAFGYRPSIQLIWLGGVTRPNAPTAMPWNRNLLLTLAGPSAGAALAGMAFVARKAVAQSSWAYGVLQLFFEANLFWALLNLVPIPPLDGGQATMAIFKRLWSWRGERAAWVLGAVVGFSSSAIAAQKGLVPGALLVGFMGLQAANQAANLLRKPRGPGVEEAERALAKAREKLQAGALEEAQTLAEQVSLEERLPAQRGAAHRVLGWIALKRGEGRLALDHFSQVQRTAVETEALAAAFSLVGDDLRALPLWERAYQERRNPTVLHEWAGALIRTGRVQPALAMPGVQPVPAFGCAERVLFLRGDYLGAARVGEESLSLSPRAETAYDTACAYARAGQTDNAVRLLRRAKTLGFEDAKYAQSDPDLTALHTHAEWEGLWNPSEGPASRSIGIS